MKKTKDKKSHLVLILSLLVIVFFALETFFLDSITKIEGVKIGLYNIFIIYAIVAVKPKYGYTLMVIKLIASMFVASPALLYPLCGGFLSVSAMIAAKKILNEKISYLGIGIIGALTYNISVYVVAALSLSSLAVFYNIPTVLLLSVVYGTLTGSLAYLLFKSKVMDRECGGNDEEK